MGGAMRSIVAVALVSTALAALVLCASWRADRNAVELADSLAAQTSHLQAMSKSVKERLGGKVASDDLASSILTSARNKFEAHKKLAAKAAHERAHVAEKHAAHKASGSSPQTVDGIHLDAAARKKFKQAVAEHALNRKNKQSAAATIEGEIASHKLTTKGIIAAVKAAEANQIKELNEGLKQQTDDLIVAKIKQLQKRAPKSNVYALNNALTKAERAQLYASKHPVHKIASMPRSQGSSWQGGQARAVWQRPAAASTSQLIGSTSLQSQNGAIMHATGGSKGGDPEALLSSYDREMLKNGPSSLSEDASQQYIAPRDAPMLSQMPQYKQPAAYPPRYEQQYAPQQAQFQQQYQGYSIPPQEGYAQPPQYGGYAQPAYQQQTYQRYQAPVQQQYAYPPGQEPQYGSAPMQQASQYGSAPMQQASQYGSAPVQQAYQYGSAPVQHAYGYQPQQEGYAPSQPQLYGEQEGGFAPQGMAQPMQQGYYPPPQNQMYAQQQQQQMYQEPSQMYAQPQQQPQQQALYQQPPQAAPQQAPAAEVPQAAAAQSESEYGESQAALSDSNVGGGTLWKLFSSPDSGSQQAPMPMMPSSSDSSQPSAVSQSGDGLSMGGDSAQGGGMSGSVSSSSMGFGGGGGDGGSPPDPQAILGSKVSTSKAKKLSPSAKAQIAAQMQALRQSIMGDFSSTTKMGDEAGYLPPPPVG